MLATLLNSHPKIKCLGEMHQFLEHVIDDKKCSCSEPVSKCSYWRDIVEKLDTNKSALKDLQKEVSALEKHKNILKYLFTSPHVEEYDDIQVKIFSKIHQSDTKVLVDSSKYIARYLLIKNNKAFKVKGIYLVRDVRGVVHSFGKKVQTSRRPISAIFYYLAINLFGQIVCWLHKDVLKVRYEDLVEEPDVVMNVVIDHLVENQDIQKFTMQEQFETPHLIGGNRMKHKKTIKVQSDLNWKSKIPRYKQVIYYLLAFPVMVINNYRI